MKPICFSNHARLQMVLRGATEEEVIAAISSGKWETAKVGKFKAKHQFNYKRAALTNNKYYKYKTVEPIFADEPDKVVVVTVKVYYSNEEVKS